MLLRVLPFVTLAFLGAALQPNIPVQQNASPQEKDVARLRTSTGLVIVDVVVHDKKGQPVHGLKAEDFALTENGAAQRLKSFEEHSAPADVARIAEGAAAGQEKLPAGTFTNATVTRDDRPLNVLLLDRLNTPMGDQAEMQKQINAYLAGARRGQRMAVFGLTDHLIQLQGFTDDPALLQTAVVKGGYAISPLREERMGGEGNSETLKGSDIITISISSMGGTAGEAMAAAAPLREMEEFTSSSQKQARIQKTLDALDALARYLAALPGRKNLIWFSGAFPLDEMPDINANSAGDLAVHGGKPQLGESPYLGKASKEGEFRQTEELMSQARVSVYPIDARGLDTIGAYSAANYATSLGLTGRPNGEKNSMLEEQINTFEEDKVDAHVMMYAIAADTGGRAAVNTNGLKEAVETAMADGANYYTIAYAPGDTRWDGKLRQIEVKVKDRSYNLSYRKGYFADDPDKLGLAKSVAAAGAGTTRAMLLALSHGGPQPTQLVFRAHVQPVSAETEKSVAANNSVSKGAKGPYRRYQVEFAVDAPSVRFVESADGHRHETLEFVAHVYNAEGDLVDSVGKSIRADVPAEAYAQFARSGIPYKLEVSVPAKGEYSLRVAVHDVEADHVGAVELPVSAVSGLAPLSASASH